MISFEHIIEKAQQTLSGEHCDGWLLYDFRRNNELACDFLNISSKALLTRRFFYWIPSKGSPVKIVHGIESGILDHLPGKKVLYRTWQELEKAIQTVLQGHSIVAMEYSPRNALPYISKVDAGTVEMVRDFGVKVISSAGLLQQFSGIWDESKFKLHLEAADVLSLIASEVWSLISKSLLEEQTLTEFDVQQFMLGQFAKYDCISDDPPICAINANSANPHYVPPAKDSAVIRRGDFILIDLWCKKKFCNAVYADITRVAVAASKPTSEQKQVFEIVRLAQKTATDFIIERFSHNKAVRGWEVDQVCRDVISSSEYADYFIHRTGHNIDSKDHGNGAHIDNYETHDDRLLLPSTCFSIEPGIYLSGRFGIRLEYDIFIHPSGKIQVTGGEQNEIMCLFNDEEK
jgi:Xaa-Pro dipeptidase